MSPETAKVQTDLDKLDKDIKVIEDQITGFDKEMKPLKGVLSLSKAISYVVQMPSRNFCLTP